MLSGTDSAAAERDKLENTLLDPCAEPIPLTLEFLKDITCNFSSEQELGWGAYGVVYKGDLRCGKTVAVKKISGIHLLEDKNFKNEVSHLVNIKHQNIVQLVGYCAQSWWEFVKIPTHNHIMAEIQSRLLCFEYMCNKSLREHLSEESSGLDWSKRREIIKGICCGLQFLHDEHNTVHLDLKPENILMDENMMPKIADFGLSRLLGTQKSFITKNPAGTHGYMAPEYQLQGEVSSKADIFSLGVIIIEIITGHRDYPPCLYLQHLSENNSRQSIGTSLLQFTEKVVGRWRYIFQRAPKYTLSSEIYSQQVKQCITIALRCVDLDLTRRPTAGDIIEMMETQDDVMLDKQRNDESLVLNTGISKELPPESVTEHMSNKESAGEVVDTSNKQNDQELANASSQPRLDSASRKPKDSIAEISCDKKGEMLSAKPLQLRFPLVPNKLMTSCSLHLINNTDDSVAFRIQTKNHKSYFLGPLYGLVLPGSWYTLDVIMLEPLYNELFTLESTIGGNQDLPDISKSDSAYHYNRFFIKAKEEGREVQEVKLSAVFVHEKSLAELQSNSSTAKDEQESENASSQPQSGSANNGPFGFLAHFGEQFSLSWSSKEKTGKLKHQGNRQMNQTTAPNRFLAGPGEASGQQGFQTRPKEPKNTIAEKSRTHKTELLSAQPHELCFLWKPKHVVGTCSLHLTNNTDERIAFRILTENRREYFLGPLYGLVRPKTMYTLRVAMCNKLDYRIFTLESTIAGGDQHLPDIQASGSADQYDHFFMKAKNKGLEVQQVKLSAVIVQELENIFYWSQLRPGNMIIPKQYRARLEYVTQHPTETWIVTTDVTGCCTIWDYNTQKTVSSFQVATPSTAIFIARKQWLVVGNNTGYIYAYCCKTMQEVKRFKAHRGYISSLDIHPTEPYMLSSFEYGSIKLWDWEKDWECVRIYDSTGSCSCVKFNPKDADYFASHSYFDVQIWKDGSSSSEFELPVPRHVECIDYFTRGDQLYLIIGHSDGSATIWDWQSRASVKRLKGHKKSVVVACAHPGVSVLITGSQDGTVRLWNASTYELDGVLDCGLGSVEHIACLKGSRRIVIGHKTGVAVTELPGARTWKTIG